MAVKAAKKQPKSLNSVRFTYKRELGFHQRQLKNGVADPTTMLLLTGSPLQPTERDAIIKFQERNLVKKDKSHKTETTQGQGSQFLIETIA